MSSDAKEAGAHTTFVEHLTRNTLYYAILSIDARRVNEKVN